MYIEKNCCDYSICLTDLNPYNLSDFFQQNLIILKYYSVSGILRAFISLYCRKSILMLYHRRGCVLRMFFRFLLKISITNPLDEKLLRVSSYFFSK